MFTTSYFWSLGPYFNQVRFILQCLSSTFKAIIFKPEVGGYVLESFKQGRGWWYTYFTISDFRLFGALFWIFVAPNQVRFTLGCLRSTLKAIILNPNDKDAKINYELLKRKIQNQDKQNQDKQNQDEQNQDEQNQDEQNQDKQNQGEQNKKMQAEAILNALQKKEQINQKLKISKSKTRNLVKDW